MAFPTTPHTNKTGVAENGNAFSFFIDNLLLITSSSLVVKIFFFHNSFSFAINSIYTFIKLSISHTKIKNKHFPLRLIMQHSYQLPLVFFKEMNKIF